MMQSVVVLLFSVAAVLAVPLLPSQTVTTPIGVARGVLDESNSAFRFAVRYATAERWAQSALVTEWSLPNNASDPAALPLACPQFNMDDSQFSEDCLSMLLYVPPTFNPASGMPVMVWIHGGSFVLGSASDPTINGSKLALATSSIVVVIQYRLGALGFLAPDGSTNLAVRDVMNALKFVQNNIAAFGGDPNQVTLAGQSSGATMIRTLLAIPEAEPLFKQGILQSDPMDFGFLTPATQQTLQSFFNSLFPCDPNAASCSDSLSLDDITLNTMITFGAANGLDPSAGMGSPIRPVRDGSFITTPLDLTAPFPSQHKPLLITTVKNEAALAIYNSTPFALPFSDFPTAVQTVLGDRTSTIVNSAFYKLTAPTNGGEADARVQLETLGTDYLWKCSSWSFARAFVSAGGSVYAGMYVVGASYPGNSDTTPECTVPGVICHQDDIQIVFGTVKNPTNAQSALVREMQARYRMFLRTGSPNIPAMEPWGAAENVNVNAKVLGGTGQVEIGSCTPDFWGAEVFYDYQVFKI